MTAFDEENDRAKIGALSEKPWDRAAGAMPPTLFQPKGMIGPEERRCYYWFGKEWYTGQGYVVDAGAFIGASTYCFAAGVSESGHKQYMGHPPIHAYDFFKVVDEYVGEYIGKEFHAVGSGETYLDIFEGQVKPFDDLITAHPGDFLEQKWSGDPIEILFIDIAKTQRLNAHVVGEFFNCLIPGRSILIQQDYYHCWHPYIHYTMEYFNDEFELVDELVQHQSRVWRLVKPIPQEKIDCIREGSLNEQERMKLLDRLLERSSPRMRPMIEVARLWQVCLDRNWGWAGDLYNRLLKDYNIAGSRELWARQAQEVHQQIEMAVARKTA